MTEADIRSMYPDLNDRGVANYLATINREADPDFQATLAERKAKGKCLTQPRIAAGTPWISDCLVHGVLDDMDHHFAMNPGAPTD